jgi:hypothetical protein
MTPLDKVLSHLPDAKKNAKGWQAKCPAHNDLKASLSISEGRDGRAVVYCFAGCSFEEIAAALGMEEWEFFADGSGAYKVGGPGSDRKIVAEYDYVDANGALLYQVCRTDPKGFFQRRPDGNGGWINNLKGIDRVLHRLPEVLAAIGRSDPIYLVEGEKDAANLAGMGLTATTNAEGARKWDRSFTLDLQGARIVILPDNDAAGRDHAKMVAAQLQGTALSTRIVELPDLPAKGDVSDWIAAGGTRTDLERLVDASPEWQPPTTPGEQGYRRNFDIERIEKVLTKPPIYYVSVQGQRVQMTIDDLMSFGRFTRVVARDTNHVPHMVNHQVHWAPYIHECLTNKRVDTEAPEEASEDATIWHRSCRYLLNKGEEDETILGDLRGPYKNESLIYFHGPTMHQFLASRGLKIEMPRLYDVLRQHGAKDCQKKVKDSEGRQRNIRSWTLEKQTVAKSIGDDGDSSTETAEK